MMKTNPDKKSLVKLKGFIIINILLALFVSCKKNKKQDTVGQSNEKESIKQLIPVQSNDFVWIYKPKGDVFPGPTTNLLKEGEFYEEWVTNDHTFTKGTNGKWHIFGITHPKTNTNKGAVHEGEYLSFHAISPETNFQKSMKKHSWEDLPKVLPPTERPNERYENHAPYIVKKDNVYHMVYGPTPIRMAVSTDLSEWELKGALFEEKETENEVTFGARDPSLLYHNGLYHIVYCADRQVKLRTSKDMYHWSDASVIFEAPDFDPESPSLIWHNNTFYLFVCSWDGIWDRKEIQGAYQHKTYVFQSDDKTNFDVSKPITTLNAHAPEIFQDESGQWFISSVEWPNRGVSIDRLHWE